MGKYLLHFCLNQGENICHPKVRNVLHPEEGGIALFPSGDEQKQLDQICIECKEAIFEIEERRCPVCLSEQLTNPKLGGLPLKSIKSQGHEVFYYTCEVCGKLLYSYKEL